MMDIPSAAAAIPGLFKLSFRDVERKLEEQKGAVDNVAADVASIKVAQEPWLARSC